MNWKIGSLQKQSLECDTLSCCRYIPERAEAVVPPVLYTGQMGGLQCPPHPCLEDDALAGTLERPGLLHLEGLQEALHKHIQEFYEGFHDIRKCNDCVVKTHRITKDGETTGGKEEE